MIIRKFREEDIGKCIALFIEVFNNPPWNNQWTYAVAEGFFKDFTNSPEFSGYVAVDGSGAIVACIVGKEKKWWRGKEYYIEEFFVSTDMQGQGMGTSLLEYTLEEIKSQGIGNVALMTDTSTPAYNFYRNQDFQEHQTLRLLYRSI